MPFLRLLLLALLLFGILPAGAQNLVAVPPLTARVTDSAGMLSAEQRSALENVLQDYETRTGSQIAVLLVPSTAPEAIEQYSIRVAEAWKIGRKNVDDGVIVVVAKDNPKSLRRLRIEAGRGVQGSLTDAQSRRIIDDVIAPHFRQGDFYGGLSAGVSAIATLIDKEHLPAPATQAHPESDRQQDSIGGIQLFPLLILAFIVLRSFMPRRRRGRGMLSDRGWNDGWGTAAGIILGNAIGRASSGQYGGGGFGGSSGGFGGGGGTFDGGGASGDW